ncbi:MAG: ABC transporter substrate-binding protein [Verrucomicrobiota bacterium]
MSCHGRTRDWAAVVRGCRVRLGRPHRWWWLAICGGLLTITAPAEPPPVNVRPAVVKIGLLLPPSEADAGDILRGAQLGVVMVNRQSGRKVQLIVRGKPGQWGTDGDEAVALALDEDVVALVAPTGGAVVHQALQVAGRTRVPVVSLSADTSVTRTGIPWTIRVGPRTDEEAAAVFAALRRPAGSPPLRVVAFVPTDRAGREVTNDLQSAARAVQVAWVDSFAVPAGIAPTAGLVSRALAAKPDLILAWLDAAAVVGVAKSLRNAGYTGAIAAPSRSWSPAVLRTQAPSAEGILFPLPLAVTETNVWWERFRREFSEGAPGPTAASGPPAAQPEPPDLVAGLAFDAVRLLADVLNRADGRPAFREFPLTRSLPGVTGELVFDHAGNQRLPLRVVAFRTDGGFQILRPEVGGTVGQRPHD